MESRPKMYLHDMEMKIAIKRQNDDLLFTASNAFGKSVQVDGGSEHQGMRPMELLLSAIGTCSVFDAVLILKKQRQEPGMVEVEVSGTRPDEGHVKPFNAVHVHYKFFGKVELAKAEKAIDLALYKYCSVSATLREETSITHSIEICETEDESQRNQDTNKSSAL
jgi:putative redox protein